MTAYPIYVTAYPKSGITWLVRLLSDVLDSPVYNRSTDKYIWWSRGEEIGSAWWGKRKKSYVIHECHEYYQPKLHDGKTIVFLQRDPRDVTISAWFYRGRKMPLEQSMRTMWEGKHYADWVNSWFNPGLIVKHTRYEWLTNELLALVYSITGLGLDKRCQQAIENHSFENMSIQMNDSRFMRKGIVGDWKNHFTKEIGKEFNNHLGEFMLKQNYIDDLDWWKEL